MSTFRILDWRPLRKNSLIGFVTIEMPSGMTIADVAVLTSTNGGCWAAPPAKPQIDRNGSVMKGPNGKAVYTPVIGFVSKERRTQFSDYVIAALREARPDALEEPGR